MSNDTDLTGRECVEWLLKTFIHMGAWGTPRYSDLDLPAREEFTDMVRNGDLPFVVERLKVVATAKGKKLPKPVLLGRVDALFNEPYTPEKRAEVSKLARLLIPFVVAKRGRPKSTAEVAPLASTMKYGKTWKEVAASLREAGHDHSPEADRQGVRRDKQKKKRT